MELRNLSEKTVYGLSIRTDNGAEMSDKGKIPALWQQFDAKVPVDYRGGERVYGVYYDYQSDHTGQFNVLAGFDGQPSVAKVELETIKIPAGKYLVFSHQGEMPQIAIDAWTEVWQYFSNEACDHQRLYTTDFEYYPNGNAIEVHIAVK